MTRTLLLIGLLAARAPAAELKLIPYPRSVHVTEGSLLLPVPVRVTLASSSAEDKFAAGLLAEEINVGTPAPAGRAPGVLIGRAGDAAVDREITRRKLDRAALGHPEGYLLDLDRAGVLVAGAGAEGVFYGVETLRQLLRPEAGGVRLPLAAIADWPALRYRGLMVDTSQGAVLSEEMLRRIVRAAAEYKLNLVNLYVEHLFPFAHSPLTAEGAQLDFGEMRRLVAYARPYHVDIVPQQQTFGHLHSLLKWELYSGMAETPRGDVLAPVDERTYSWIFDACKQLAEVFPSPFLHIGSDETFELGRGRTRELVEREGMGKVYVAHLRRAAALLRPLNKRLIFWGDIVQKNPEAIPEIPKELIVASWVYQPLTDFSPYLLPFRKAGLEVWVCPGVANWRRIFPNFTEAAGNINGFVRDGKKLGATGMLNTHWNDHGEELFNLAWYGVLFGAAAAWQPGEVDRAAFDRAFDWTFYRSEGEAFVKTVRRLEEINGLLLAAGLGDADDRLMWLDPFSHRGSLEVQRLLAVAPEIRKRAEQALVDLRAGGGQARRHAGTLPFLRFAARRLDTLGLRVELSKDIADYYRDALAHSGDRDRVSYDLEQITGRSGIGRVQDILDAVSELKVMLRSLWPYENRPYYLDSLLVRYDAELLYWQYKRELFHAVRELYQPVEGLPKPEQVGLYLP